MIASGQPEATGRLQRALVAFQRAQAMLLATHRKLKGLPAEDVERFWVGRAGRSSAIFRLLRSS